jgi:hypothetical protein
LQFITALRNSAASTPDGLADSGGYHWSWDALHFAGFNVSHTSAGFGLPAFLDSRTQMQSFGQPVHLLHDLLSGQVPGLFNNLIKRHRHVTNLPTTQPQLKSEAGIGRFGLAAMRQVAGGASGAERSATSGQFPPKSGRKSGGLLAFSP